MELTIHSPERTVLKSVPVQEVTLPTGEGEIQILDEHAAFIGVLGTGEFHYKDKAGKTKEGVITSGFFQMENNTLTVMAETLEFKEEIDLTRAQRAQNKAEQELNDPSIDPKHFDKYKLKLERALIRQQLAKK